ncbi:hypothetical protein [Xanthomarina sp. F2636L]|uniref:hypothetical protein n=1 Tax=Xanthomarina sp. F2636L TaxID=2996018 RepID=UPI00225E4CDA|nr:hypothetical protein [Xanthomarina sp. F2636L]MCX7550571.1 hypothetical protein [Xanthomarina sp. F2636L]
MKSLLLTFYLVVFTSSVFSQTAFAKIEKNRNLTANSLFHELNATKDSLLLKSNMKISHVYSINSEYKREIDVYLNDTNLQIPLTNLSQGKHVMVVNLTPKKIIFVIHFFGSFSMASIDD